MIPLSQVTSRAQVISEDPIIVRRDRFNTLTIHADPRTGLPSKLFNRVKLKIEAIELPAGYALEWGGEYEDSANARAALAKPLPMALAVRVLIVVCLFNSIRATIVIWIIMPLALIGVTSGLLITGTPFGFMALLGILSLAGEQIKNAIVVLSKIKTEVESGKHPYHAIMDGSTAKVRPVMMVALTTVLGMIPLLTDPFFGGMAVCVMFGLSFACVVTMLIMPAIYAIIYPVEEPRSESAPVAPNDPGTLDTVV